MSFTAPVAEQIFALRVNAGIDELASHAAFASASPDMVAAIVEGLGRFAEGEWAPLDRIGDTEGAVITDGVVTLPAGFAEAYQAYVEAGWNALSAPVAFGGQGLPFALGCTVLETLGAANMAFSLLPMLTTGAIEALSHHGSPVQQALYLPKIISGAWAGTMNLTEPQAGSDVGALRSTATPISDGPDAGLYHIAGSKIFITWGEHDLAENIIHLVLARTPGAPEGSRGISLFIVPKYRVNADGTLGPRNDLDAVRLEHKLGIHASPTCEMRFGDGGQCLGELVGRENEGLKAMFTMMNAARINVGNQGVQVAEAALQKASAYACERIQSPRSGGASKVPVAIIEHPDVRRMVLRMRALTEATRALLYYTAGQVDRGRLGLAGAQARADLLVPLLKAWGTDNGCEVASLGVQIHGGMGYMEETGAAQHYRDARIAPIYEGTNGIQAADFVTRKLGLDGGGVLGSLLADIAQDAADSPTLVALAQDCGEVARWMTDSTSLGASLDDRLAGSAPFLAMCATAVAGWQLLRQARAASQADTPPTIALTKPVVASYFLTHIVPQAAGCKAAAMAGAELLYALSAENFWPPSHSKEPRLTDQINTLHRIAEALERMVQPPLPQTDWLASPAYVWDGAKARAVAHLEAPALALLRGIDAQKAVVTANVNRLAAGHASHDMLLWGARGMGKSALLRSSIATAQSANPGAIALVQVTPDALPSLALLFGALAKAHRRFLVFIDDLGFEEGDGAGPRALRSWLEGGVEARPRNVRLAVTSNRRVIVSRNMSEQDDPINPRDVVDDRLALADRFGLSVGFHNCSQDDYLAIISGYAESFGLEWGEGDALEWSKRRGARSGRVAWHFVTELAGRVGKLV